MKLTPVEFLNKLKTEADIPRVVALIGEEVFYRDLVRKKMLDLIFSDTPEAEREIHYFDQDVDLGEVEVLVNTYPFFAAKNVVIIKSEKIFKAADKEKQIERFLTLLENVPEYSTVILQLNALDGRQKATKLLQKDYEYIECMPVRPNNLKGWLTEQATTFDRKFDYEAIECIMEYLEPVDFAPLQLLIKELEKLYVYAGDRKVWTRDDVEKIFSALPEVSAFALANAVADKKMLIAIELLQEEKKKKTAVPLLLGMLNAKIRRLLQIQECLRNNMLEQEIIQTLKLGPFLGKITVRQSKNFTERSLRDALMGLNRVAEGLSLGERQYPLIEETLVKLLK